eukprot:snap_masked-scaffold3953_size7055-processed-gene-0.0 protein:Tk09136 transcript:snap_masked-scaffold3953_size7055-processed-gene-0.0-mRNA-1 annotation:"phosphotyrosine protein phosphatase"
MGNICRSPAAEAVFLHQLEQAQLAHRVEVDSAGTTGYHQGERADKRMRAAAKNRGYTLHSRARGVLAADFDHFDLVVAMDKANLQDLQRFGGTAQLALFSEYLSDEWPEEVPDPYYGGDEGFEQVLDMLEAGSKTLMESLLS